MRIRFAPGGDGIAPKMTNLKTETLSVILQSNQADFKV